MKIVKIRLHRRGESIFDSQLSGLSESGRVVPLVCLESEEDGYEVVQGLEKVEKQYGVRFYRKVDDAS